MAISCVLFDLGGVVLNWDDAWFVKEISKDFKLEEKDVDREFKKFLPDVATGRIGERELWYNIGEKLQSYTLMEYNKSLLDRIFRKNVTLNDSVAKLSQEISNNGITVGILSNTEPVTFSVFQNLMSLDHFEHKFLSYEIGHAKPEPEIYHHVINNIPFQKEELFFIDDLKPNVESAISEGIDAVQFSNYDKLLQELEKRNLYAK
ncbi:MAG: HAD family hydrolase [Nitrosopumilus sp.]